MQKRPWNTEILSCFFFVFFLDGSTGCHKCVYYFIKRHGTMSMSNVRYNWGLAQAWLSHNNENKNQVCLHESFPQNKSIITKISTKNICDLHVSNELVKRTPAPPSNIMHNLCMWPCTQHPLTCKCKKSFSMTPLQWHMTLKRTTIQKVWKTT